MEQKEKHRIEDAILATKAAVEEGIVSACGTVLIRAQQVLKDGLGLAGDELTGLRIVEKALAIRQIYANGGKEGSLILQRVREMKRGAVYAL